MRNKKKVNKDMLNEELNRFKNLMDYDYYAGEDKVSENFSFYDVRQEMEDDRPNDVDDLILGVSEEDENELNGDEGLDADVEDVEGDLGVGDEPESEPEAPEDDMGDLDLGDDAGGFEEPADDEIELDVTQLVQGTEEAKQSADSANQKIDQLMNMVNNLEGKLQSMDAISSKIDGLENELEKRAPTPEEQIEMRSLDSYPYNLKLTDYWAEKEGQYDVMGEKGKEPKEYVLTQDDVDNDYSEHMIKNSYDDNEYIEEDI